MAASSYANFDLLLQERTESGFPVRVLHSPAGQARGLLRLPTDLSEGDGDLRRLRQVLRAGPKPRSLFEAAPAIAERIGGHLFDLLFEVNVRSCFDASRLIARQAGQGLRLRLRIDAPELVTLPWELLCDRRGDRFLALSSQTPVVRYLELQQGDAPVAVDHPLRVLVVVANPRDQEPLDVAAETDQLVHSFARLQQQGLVRLRIVDQAAPLAIQRVLREEPFNVVHYVGHGEFDPIAGEGTLMLVDRQGDSQPFTGRQLGELLHDAPALRLVVLNACSTATSTGADPFSSVASALVHAGIPAVVAMQTSVTDQAALLFAQVFYETINDGLPIDAAVAEGRKAVNFGAHHPVEWAIPQLFMRSNDGLLFRFGAAPTRPANAAATTAPRPATMPPIGPAASAPAITLPVGLATAEPAAAPPVTTTPPIAPAAMPATGPTRSAAVVAATPAGDGRPMQVVTTFAIDTYPVTQADYQRYLAATGAPPPDNWPRGRPPTDQANHPVTGITWHEAVAYATWAGKRLPTVTEWELAAGGGEGYRYPWGALFDGERCNTQERGGRSTTSVDRFPGGASPYGVHDLAGNVWEWTLDEVKPRGLGRPGTRRALKGGAFNTPAAAAVISGSSSAWPDERLAYVGFRCVRSLDEG